MELLVLGLVAFFATRPPPSSVAAVGVGVGDASTKAVKAKLPPPKPASPAPAVAAPVNTQRPPQAGREDQATASVRPPPVKVQLPQFTDLDQVANLRTTQDETRSLDGAIIKNIPFAGTFIGALGFDLDLHPNAAGLSPQQIAFVNGPGGRQGAIATGVIGVNAAGGSGNIAKAQEDVIARLGAVENRDNTKQLIGVQNDQDKGTAQGETGTRIGAAADFARGGIGEDELDNSDGGGDAPAIVRRTINTRGGIKADPGDD